VNRLIDEPGIVFIPGKAFGLDDEKLYIRGAYVDFSGTQALNAVEEFQKNPKEPLALDWGNHIFESIHVLGTF